MSKATITKKQIQAKLSSLLYSFQGDIAYELLEGYVAHDAEDTELEPYVSSAVTALTNLINKFDDMCEQYEINIDDDEVFAPMSEEELDRAEQLSFDFEEN